jgi:predicted aspartyl protease
MGSIHRDISVLALCLLFSFHAVAQPAASERRTEEGRLDRLVEERDYPQLQRELTQVDLDETDRAFFEGILANRRNELLRSIGLLRPIIPKLEREDPKRAAEALRALADDFVKTFRYANADTAFSKLLSGYAKQLNPADRQSIDDDAGVNRLLKDALPQRIELSGGFSLPTHHSPIGTIDTDLTVNGVKKSWILDTGANFSVVSESVAHQMGLKLSEGTAQTQGSSGAENSLHIAIISELKIGTATVRNMVVLVLQDKALTIPLPKGKYQIEAILGYPVLSALGQLTFTKDDKLEVGVGGNNSGAALYMQELDPLVTAKVNGQELLMFFDSGASSTTFTVRYYNAFRHDVEGFNKIRHGIGGAGGAKLVTAYKLPRIAIMIGNETAVLENVSVIAEPLGTDQDLLFGTLGRDLTSGFKSFTIDFKAMRFRLTK